MDFHEILIEYMIKVFASKSYFAKNILSIIFVLILRKILIKIPNLANLSILYY